MLKSTFILKITRAFFTCLFVAVSFFANAYTFRVLGVSGKILLKSGNQEVALRAGTKLDKGQSLILENGYCGLVHASGKILELKTAGTFSVEELSKQVSGNAKAKVTEKYLDYVLGQLTQKDADEVDKNVRKYMDVPGAVDRSVITRASKATAKVAVFKSNDVRPASYLLEWESVEGVSSYTVNLMNRFDEIIFSKDVNENKIEIDFRKLPAQGPDSYTLQVSYSGKKAEKTRSYLFKVMAEEEIGLQEEKSPASQMLNGIICEEKHYFLDALQFYREAQRLEPGVSAYSEAYERLKAKMD